MLTREYINSFLICTSHSCFHNYKYIKTLNTSDDIAPEDYSAGEGRANYKIDSFAGSSVSTNNIIRMLNALYKYHSEDEFFAGSNS